MTSNDNYSDDKNKHSVNIDDRTLNLQKICSYVTNCQICEWYGFQDEKILVKFEGVCPEDEDGFVEKFTEYNYDPRLGAKRIKHVHKCNIKLLQEHVDIALQIRNGG
jgi:hypothetical protein